MGEFGGPPGNDHRVHASNSINSRIRLKAENDRLKQEIALLREEIRIRDARIKLMPPQRRPHHPPRERMSILELRAARSWSVQQSVPGDDWDDRLMDETAR